MFDYLVYYNKILNICTYLQYMFHQPVCDSECRAEDEPCSQTPRDGDGDDRRVHLQCDFVHDPEEEMVDDDDREERCDQLERETYEVHERTHEEVHERQEASEDDVGTCSADDGDVLRKIRIETVRKHRVQHGVQGEPEGERQI